MRVLVATIKSQFYLPLIPFEGEHYKGVFGLKYDVVESFMLRNQLHGPGWVTLSDSYASIDAQNEDNYLSFKLNNEAHLSLASKSELPSFSVLSIYIQKNKNNKFEGIFLSNHIL